MRARLVKDPEEYGLDPRRVRPPWWFSGLSLAATVAAALLTAFWHRRWEAAEEGTTRRGVFDVLCHGSTAIAVILPSLPYVRDRAGFLRAALASALLIDLDHVAAARSIDPIRCMNMGIRPPSHSMIAPVALALLAERLRPDSHHNLGAFLGLGSHLLRDIGTGGVPLVHPRRVVAVPYRVVVQLLIGLGLVGRHLARRPPRNRVLRPRVSTAPTQDVDLRAA